MPGYLDLSERELGRKDSFVLSQALEQTSGEIALLNLAFDFLYLLCEVVLVGILASISNDLISLDLTRMSWVCWMMMG